MQKRAYLILSLALLAAQAACAHEKREVAGHQLVVGFLNEPAFSDQVNALDLRVSRGGEPVEGLEEALTASVVRGEASRELPLKKKLKKPGEYAAYFLPSQPGDYAFRVRGKLGGTEIDETFDTRDGKFSSVGDPEQLRFPA